LTLANLSEGRAIKPTTEIGDFPPSLRIIPVQVQLQSPATELLAEVVLRWVTFDRKDHSSAETLIFEAQPTGVDWISLATLEPYDLEPVTSEDELVGRSEIISQLLGMLAPNSMGSAIIHGQKRVGKTSIAKTLESRILKHQPDLHVLYLEAGEYVRPDAIRTIQALGRRLCVDIRRIAEDLDSIAIPEFEDALAPLGDYLAEIVQKKPSIKLAIILDEFDELPTDLYTRNEVAEAFFLTIRSLSAKRFASFILIGSERMRAIMEFQGQSLNKFKPIRVDYFDRQTHWADFESLVRKPTSGKLEFSDAAVHAIYDFTAGNPYFSKLLCKSLLKTMVSRRDSHVSVSEVNEACIYEIRNIDVNSFVHFWEDGIVEKGEERERLSLTRRKVLLGFGEVLRRASYASFEQLKIATAQYEVSESVLRQQLAEFVQREVLEEHDSIYKVKVRFFGDWLREAGVCKILSRLSDRIVTAEKRATEEAFVRSEEILSLLKAWNHYKGQTITPDHVRMWLRQFGSNLDQRLMFKVLSHIRFYSESEIRAKLADMQAMLSRDVVSRVKWRVGRIDDLIVSFLEGPGKSGYQYARLYAEENKIVTKNVVEPSKMNEAVQAGIKGVLWVDDFIGSGQSAIDHFEQFRHSLVDLQRKTGIAFFFAAITGLETGRTAIQSQLDEWGLKVAVQSAIPSGTAIYVSIQTRVFLPATTNVSVRDDWPRTLEGGCSPKCLWDLGIAVPRSYLGEAAQITTYQSCGQRPGVGCPYSRVSSLF
jgi:AAA+ ATPase superfamily predicted ATPase